MDRLRSRLKTAKERIREHNEMSIKMIKSEEPREKKKSEQSIKDPWDGIK